MHRTAKKYLKSGGGSKKKLGSTHTARRARSPKSAARRAPSPAAIDAALNNEWPMLPSRPVALAAPVAAPLPAKKLNPAAFAFVPEPELRINLRNNNTTQRILSSIDPHNAVAIDCEMVGVGPVIDYVRGYEVRKSSLAQVSIVDVNGSILLNKYVIPKEGIDEITDYRTLYSGITEELMLSLNADNNYDKVVSEVNKILKNKIIVGHGLTNDFRVLDYKLDANNIIWDTSVIDAFKYDHHMYGRAPRKLKELAAEIGNNIQIEPNDPSAPKGHSPVEDARASMNLYRRYVLGLPRVRYTNMKK